MKRQLTPTRGSPGNVVEVRVDLHELATNLIEMQHWLRRHGCTSQVLRCVRDGGDASVRVEFDYDRVGLTDAFRRAFG